jgi:hypothetical protein
MVGLEHGQSQEGNVIEYFENRTFRGIFILDKMGIKGG